MGILAADNNVWLDARPDRRRCARPGRGSSLGARQGACRARSRCCRRRCSATAPPTSAWSPRTSSGCCSWASSFVVSAYLQVVRGYNAIQTGVIFTAATVGLLVSSLAAERLAKRYAAADPHRGRLRRHHRRHRACCSPWSSGYPERLGVRARTAPDRTRPRRDADPVGQRRAVQLRRGRSRARSPACRAACPTSAPPSAPRSPAPSWSPASPRHPNAPTRSR